MDNNDRLGETEFRRQLLANWRDTNRILLMIAQAMATGTMGSTKAAQMASLVAERQVSGVRSAGGDGGVNVQRYPLPNKCWIVARRHPDGKEDVVFEDADGNRREITPEEAEALLIG